MYNSIREASMRFLQYTGHIPTKVLLSKKQYLKLINEMYGNQQEFLIKNNSIMGLSVSISKNDDADFIVLYSKSDRLMTSCIKMK